MSIKYLKLMTEPALPDNVHITFAYFGSIDVSKSVIMNHLSKIESFSLVPLRNDKFGPNNDIPCVVFSVPKEIIESRKEMLLGLGSEISEQNRLEWAPHVSNVQLENLEPVYKVIGIKSNDGLFGVMFE